MVKAIRVFYRKSDNQIVWTHTLIGIGEFPTTVEEDLAEIPDKMPNGETPLAGVPEDYACIEETDPERIAGFSASDSNTIVNGELIIGEPRPPAPGPTPPLSTHLARLDSVDTMTVKPATVTRLFLTETGVTTIWDVTGKEYSYDCYVTQSVVDEWQAGKIAAGDLLLIEFLEGDTSKAIATKKIYRTW